MHAGLLEAHDAPAFAARRARFRARLGADARVLVPAGRAPARNYAANRHPFRASSHFLHLVGLPLEGALFLASPDGDRLLLPPTSPGDALWHGESVRPETIAERTGLRVETLDSLEAAITGDVGTLPTTCLATRAQLSALLGRSLDSSDAHDADRLARDAILEERLVHDALAIRELRRSADATVAAHLDGLRATRPGLRARDVRATMEHAIAQRGFGLSYPPIVTPHGEILHDETSHHELSSGHLLLADVGAESPLGYAGDVTRTWPIDGRFLPEHRDLYEIVLAAQLDAIAHARPGVRYRDLHLRASRKLAEGLVALGLIVGDLDELVADDVHALFFPHGLGHLLGLDVHDMEDLGDVAGYAHGRARSERFGLSALRLDRDLAASMAVTIEPGLYFVPAILDDADRRAATRGRVRFDRVERFRSARGIRIEDDVLITPGDADVLTRALPKSVAGLEALVGAGAS